MADGAGDFPPGDGGLPGDFGEMPAPALGEGEGDIEEEELEFPFLKSDHPLLERLQRALMEQLERQKEQRRLQLTEKQEELKKLVGHRENIGVTLYHAQQQLAK